MTNNTAEDWTAFVNDRPAGEPGGITVDVGELEIGQPTHTTRDGYPMNVQYDRRLGFLVAVDTSAAASMTFGADKISADTAAAVLEAFGYPTWNSWALGLFADRGQGWDQAPLRRSTLALFVGLDPINPVPGIHAPLPERTTKS